MMKKNSKSKWLTEGVVLAAIPLIGYAMSYAYELGYASHFKIPQGLINISLNNLFSAIFATVLFFFVMVLVSSFAYYFVPKEKNLKSGILEFLIYPLLAIFALLLLLGWDKKLFFNFFWILIPFLLIGFLLPLIIYRNKKTYLEKLKADDDRIRRGAVKEETLFDKLISKLGFNNFRFIIIIIFLIASAYFVGNGQAIKQEFFYILKSNEQDKVVLRIYGDTLIASEFDRSTEEISSNYLIYKISNSTTLKLEKIGRLKMKDK